MFIAALADMAANPDKAEVFILWAAAQGRPARRQLDFADPHDEHLRPEHAQSRPVGREPPRDYV
jgi:hypothetical protein